MAFEFIFCAIVFLTQLALYLGSALVAIQSKLRYSKKITWLFVWGYTIVALALDLLFIIDIAPFPQFKVAAIILWIVLTIAFGMCILRGSLFQMIFVVFIIFNNQHSVFVLSNYIKYLNFLPSPFSADYLNFLYISFVVMLATAPLIWYVFAVLFKRVVEGEVDYTHWRLLFILPASYFVVMTLQYFNYDFTSITSPMYINFLLLVAFKLCAYSSYVMALKLLSNTVSRLRAQEQERALERNLILQTQRSQEMERYIQNTDKLRHDWKHQIIMLHGLVKKQDYHTLENYLDQYMGENFEIEHTAYCGINSINSLLWFYKNTAAIYDIDFEAGLDLPDLIKIDEDQLCSIIGNLLENAADACKEMGHQHRFITIKVKHVVNTLTIIVENSYENEILRDGQDFVSTKHQGKSIGIEAVTETVNQNGGNYRFKYGDGVFQACIMLLN